jgi:hypothetical protein
VSGLVRHPQNPKGANKDWRGSAPFFNLGSATFYFIFYDFKGSLGKKTPNKSSDTHVTLFHLF